MAFVVEDGSARADANSYLSVADADAYWADHGAPVTWTGVDAVKEAALRAATAYLDRRFGARFRGCRVSSLQRLAWPRNGAVRDGYELESNALPRELKEATAELALRQLTESGGLMPDVADPSNIIAESVSVGPISESKTYDGSGKALEKRWTVVDVLMRAITRGQEIGHTG